MHGPNALTWIPAADVRIGDSLACLLSDAYAYLPVTGWSDSECDLSRYGLGISTRRTFTVAGRPWWVETADLRHDLAGQALIVARDPSAEQSAAARDRHESERLAALAARVLA